MSPPSQRAKGAPPPPDGPPSPIDKRQGEQPTSPEQRLVMQEQLTACATPSDVAAAAIVSRSAARHYIKTGGKPSRQGRTLFFFAAEEELLMQYIRTRVLIGTELTRDAYFDCCENCILLLPPARQDQAVSYLGAETRPGKKLFHLVLRRWPNLERYRVGMLQQARAENSRPEVLAGWFAFLEPCMRDLGITKARRTLNTDETHVAARLPIGYRTTTVGPVVME